MSFRALPPLLPFAALLIAACSQAPVVAPRVLSDEDRIPEGCTSIMVGRLASADGSVMTSHTCDGNYRTWVRVVPAADHPAGATTPIVKGRMQTAFPGDLRGVEELGRLDQVSHTYSYLDTAYPCMNEHQLAIGETTFGGRGELRSDQGIFHVEELQRLALERTRTARDAIRLMGAMALEHGYVDAGECLTVADPNEVWQFEILGPGKGRKGAVWAAQRIPDRHVGVSANIARIGRLDLGDREHFMASPNVENLAVELGLWDPSAGQPFSFWKAYSGEKPFRAREFFVLSSLAPSLGLDFDAAEELPFSVEPERPVSVRELMGFFRQTYEGTRFELTRNLTVPNGDGEPVRSPHVSPWTDRGEQALFNALKPGAVEFHRPIPVMFNAYSLVLQCRSWLPDPVGGLCWFGFDNPGTTPRMPLFCGITALPEDFAVCGQHGFRRDSASWAFRRASRLACIRWGDNAAAVAQRIDRYEERALAELPGIEQRALEVLAEDPAAARRILTEYSVGFCRAATHDYWDFGDALWPQYRFRM